LIAMLVALAAVAGTYAALRTSDLGIASSGASGISDAEIAARDKQLDKAETALGKLAARKPPKLPPLPRATSSSLSMSASSVVLGSTAAAQVSHSDDDDHEGDDHDEDDHDEDDHDHSGKGGGGDDD
jgi:hypothetical protein